MPTVESIASAIIAREGGYVNDRDDPGGATKYGVTVHTMRRLGLDLNQDGRIDASDVQSLSKSQAKRIFIDHYFHAPRIADLPTPLHATVFDMRVNAGGWAVRILQRLTTKMGFPARDDGVIGPQTLEAVRRAVRAAPNHIVDAYGIERRNYYYSLADRRPSSRKFARRSDGGKGGWIRRAEEFISPKFHLSDADHRERTSSWG
ncbi:MAG: holin-associated N-acetylmuramidase [Boseongicola sp.]|nr:holin-associated N-acetylmuramidase [Boseongicola sp.]